MVPPFSTFSGFIKQVDGVGLNRAAIAALDAALPHFRASQAPRELTPELVRQATGFDLSDLGPSIITPQTVPNRRFSGGDLPRGRYYSVCDRQGHDHGTLAAEMSAYRSIRNGALSLVFDASEEAEQAATRMLARSIVGRHRLWIGFAEGVGYTNPFIAVLERDFRGNYYDHRTITPLGRIRMAWCMVVYWVQALELSSVLDLRQLEAQRWFAETFSRPNNGSGVFLTFDRPAAFVDFLPFLLSEELGGSGFTEAIGRYLRARGALGLVYPSARTDSSALQRDGELSESRGWCFVDYRDAPSENIPLIDCTEQTPLAIDQKNIRLRYWPDGPTTGSWQTEGIQLYYRTSYNNEVANVIGMSQWEAMTEEFIP